MKFIIKWLVAAAAVFAAAWFLPGVTLSGGFTTALIVAAALGILNMIIKPIFTVLTLPITFMTFGIFLFFINSIMVLVADYFISGFSVDGILWALVFGLVTTVVTYVLEQFLGKDNK